MSAKLKFAKDVGVKDIIKICDALMKQEGENKTALGMIKSKAETALLFIEAHEKDIESFITNLSKEI